MYFEDDYIERVTDLEYAVESIMEVADEAAGRRIINEIDNLMSELQKLSRNANKAMKKKDFRAAIRFADEGIGKANDFKASIADMSDAELQEFHGLGFKAIAKNIAIGLGYGIGSTALLTAAAAYDKKKFREGVHDMRNNVQTKVVKDDIDAATKEGNKVINQTYKHNVKLVSGVGAASTLFRTISQHYSAKKGTEKLTKANINAMLDEVIAGFNKIKEAASAA